MNQPYGRLVAIGVGLFGLTFVGCSDSESGPKGGEPAQISPGMEQMKQDMIDKMKKKEFGKDLTKKPRAK